MSDNAHSEKLKQIIDCLGDLDSEAQVRLLRAASVYLGVDQLGLGNTQPIQVGNSFGSTDSRKPNFGERGELPAKDFIHQKSPSTDVDRVACLAYYLTHYRGRPHFKTLDISALNTEAAQLKFSNTAFAVNNAANAGMIVPAGKGHKQLSALGERYVEALPDRAAAREILAKLKSRRRKKKDRVAEPHDR